MDERLMPRDMTTRWNSTFTMLDFAVQHQKPLDMLSVKRSNGLRELELKEEEWKIVVQLHNVLKVCFLSEFILLLIYFRIIDIQDATAFFSRGTPNLATVIPAMDHIDHILASQSVNKMYDAPIRAVLAMGKKTLNKYYNLTDSSEVYRIAMGPLSLLLDLLNTSLIFW